LAQAAAHRAVSRRPILELAGQWQSTSCESAGRRGRRRSRVRGRRSLADGRIAVDLVGDLPAAGETIAVNRYACAILDRMLPSGDCVYYLAERRATGWTTPVLFLTAMDSVADRVAGGHENMVPDIDEVP
jgi:CheY-like chemotaxis protein